MPSFGRWQVAGETHTCEECGGPIHPRNLYLRLGFLDKETYRMVLGRQGIHQVQGGVIPVEKLRRLFQLAGRGGYPIQRWHPICWKNNPTAPIVPTGRSGAVLAGRSGTAR